MGAAKREALEIISRMPETSTTADIMEALYFKEQIEQGLEDVAESRTISHMEMKKRIAQWRKTGGR